MDYVEISDARKMPGIKLVLSAGVPGPWGEAAKAIFHVKGIPYVPVRQRVGEENPDLVDWTGLRNAPIVINGSDRPLDRWLDIALFAERLEPTPSLFPKSAADRALMVGLSNEICGERGLAWSLRALLFNANKDKFQPGPMTRAYAEAPEELESSTQRVADILRALSNQMNAQVRAGSRYMAGDSLSILDLYLACFLAMVEPMSQEDCPLPDWLKGAYGTKSPEIRNACDPVLIRHRAFVFEKHLKLPMDF